MSKFWELVKQSVIVQATLTLMLGITICYMWIMGMSVPPALEFAFGTVLGFYFGTKAQIMVTAKDGK